MNRALASSAKPNAHVEVFDAQGYDFYKICDNLLICVNLREQIQLYVPRKDRKSPH